MSVCVHRRKGDAQEVNNLTLQQQVKMLALTCQFLHLHTCMQTDCQLLVWTTCPNDTACKKVLGITTAVGSVGAPNVHREEGETNTYRWQEGCHAWLSHQGIQTVHVCLSGIWWNKMLLSIHTGNQASIPEYPILTFKDHLWPNLCSVVLEQIRLTLAYVVSLECRMYQSSCVCLVTFISIKFLVIFIQSTTIFLHVLIRVLRSEGRIIFQWPVILQE